MPAPRKYPSELRERAVNVALPSIRDGGITGLQWVVDGYTLMPDNP